ncbi:MAG: sulfatase-like hydrolase/transferase [Verrucomicrobiales bacterium]|nr:sulfatase-like hydrolase/transferase [Verrucomicrobiales bacterium]
MKPSFSLFAFTLALFALPAFAADKPHIVLVMADDQGWGQTSYNGHPQLKTPQLDALAADGLRFNRFYAGASNCSPSRATVLTGRSNDRTGVYNHGFPLRLQEKTIAEALKKAGYATGHFGKWHLNGLRGPGAPVLATDSHHPGAFGFDHWLTATNFFDRDPLLSRMGEFEAFSGDSSEVAMGEAVKFIQEKAPDQPTFTVVWFGTPHSPFVASEEDKAPFKSLPENYQNQYGEIIALDRSIGDLREGLSEAGIAENTLIWYCSDNGGLAEFGPETVGGLRGSKNTMYEGGLRVPGIIHWPAKIKGGGVTDTIAGTVDIFPTIAELVELPSDSILKPCDGISLVPLLEGKDQQRGKALPFRHDGRGVLVESRYKLLYQKGKYELYDLTSDPEESVNLIDANPEIAARMKADYEAWDKSVEASVAGKDYESGIVDPDQPERRYWHTDPAYAPFLEELMKRPEYGPWIERQRKRSRK